MQPVILKPGEPALQPVPDLILPTPGCVILIERRDKVEEVAKARWTGTEWIFYTQYPDGSYKWIREIAEENVYQELEDQPSEEPNEAVSRPAGPVSG